jgi:chitin synthase
MMLAEDRILCLGIFCQHNKKYVLKYIPNAVARTDAVDSFEEFMLQRRRWINSSWYAIDYVLRNYDHHIDDSQHGFFLRHFIVHVNMFFSWLSIINTYLLTSFFFFSIYLLSISVVQPAF